MIEKKRCRKLNFILNYSLFKFLILATYHFEHLDIAFFFPLFLRIHFLKFKIFQEFVVVVVRNDQCLLF